MVVPILYYDFYVGVPNSHPKEWKYQGLKIAAHSPEMAVYSKMLLHIGTLPKRTRKFVLGGDILYLAEMSIRLIVEFEVAHQEGRTKYRFKKLNEYKINNELKIS